MRGIAPTAFLDPQALACGLTEAMLRDGVEATYRVLDSIDGPLLDEAGMRIAEVVELANLSAMLGNVLASSIVRHSGGAFERAGAHKYQDLRACTADGEHIEIKVALEANKPKGHLAKPGHYLTFRYVLGNERGRFERGNRGDVVWLWEVRFGLLEEEHFAISNTDGDSGKTAVVTKEGMQRLKLVYYDPRFLPLARANYYWKTYGSAGSEQPELPLVR